MKEDATPAARPGRLTFSICLPAPDLLVGDGRAVDEQQVALGHGLLQGGCWPVARTWVSRGTTLLQARKTAGQGPRTPQAARAQVMLWHSRTRAGPHLPTHRQAPSPEALVPGAEHLVNTPGKLVNIVVVQPGGRTDTTPVASAREPSAPIQFSRRATDASVNDTDNTP